MKALRWIRRAGALGALALWRRRAELAVPAAVLGVTLAALAIILFDPRVPAAERGAHFHIQLNALWADFQSQFGRWVPLVLALVVPVVAGLGLNFAIVVGAMAGQLAVLWMEDRGIGGAAGFALAALAAVALGSGLGAVTGAILNRARGREMITGIIFGYFASAVYQLLLLLLAGPVLPVRSSALLLPDGVGLRATIDLPQFSGGKLGPPQLLPLASLALVAGLLVWLLRTALGQCLRAVGEDERVAASAGIAVERTRIIAMMVSTALGAFGMVVYLRDFTTVNTFTQHDQVGFYAVAALLVGGASVRRATVAQAIVGAALFQLLLLTAPQAMERLVASPQVGEYCRSLFVFVIIGLALVLHAWRERRARAGARDG